MTEIIERLKASLANFSFVNVIEILLITAALCFMIKVLLDNNAGKVIVAYLVYTIGSGLYFIFANPPYGALAMILLQAAFALIVVCLFATEIKRAIWYRRSGDHKRLDGKNTQDTNVCIEEIVKAVQNMSKNDVGAIIILSNGNLPTGVLESGVYVDADISAQLIETIFFPKSALHDGALILNGTKIQAAGCFLPLAQEINLSKDLGSRHRAGIGLTETVNVTAIIVSEETGIISIAKGGKIIRYVDTTVLKQTLKQFYWQELID